MATGLVVAKTGMLKFFSLIGWAAFLVGFAPMAAGHMSPKTPIVGWMFMTVAAGIGNGIIVVTCTLAVQASAEHRATVPPAERIRVKVMAAALNPFFRALGQTIGVVVGQATVSNELRKRIGSHAAADVLQTIRKLPVGSAEREKVGAAVVESLNVVWLILTILCGISLMLCFMTQDYAFTPQAGAAGQDKDQGQQETCCPRCARICQGNQQQGQQGDV